MQLSLKKIEDVIIQMVRRELYERRLTQSDLAILCTVTSRTLHSEFCRGFTSRKMRYKVEWALQMPFWASPSEWALRHALAKRFGVDLFLLTLPGLRKLAVAHGVRNWKLKGGYLSRRAILDGFITKLNSYDTNSKKVNDIC